MTTPLFPPLPERRDVTPEMFRDDIMPAGEAVVMRGLVADWPMVGLGDEPRAIADDLLRRRPRSPVRVMRARPEQKGRFFYADDMRQFNFEQGEVAFSDFLEALLGGAGGDTLYMGSTPVAEVLPDLVADLPLPHAPRGTPPRIWIGNRTVVSIHHDGSHNIACVAAGRRRFTLFPPEQVANLYPGPIEHTVAGPQLSMVDLDAPDLDRFPRFSRALETARTAELAPGDAIYIPPLWWHHVRATEDFNVLVNAWWRAVPDYSREPLEAMLLSLLSIRQMPEPERRAWRAMFDYFVFKTDGEPMAHLPDELGGILGTHSKPRAEAIWKFFKDQMR